MVHRVRVECRDRGGRRELKGGSGQTSAPFSLMISLYSNDVVYQAVTTWLERVTAHTRAVGMKDVTEQVGCKWKHSSTQQQRSFMS